MFTTSKALLTFSLLVAIVNSTTGPVIQDFDPNSDDALSTNMFFDGISTDDDMTTSGALTDMFDSGLTVDANPVGDQQNLLTADASAGNSCSAEDRQSLSASGRLRRREGSSSKSGGGKTCVSPTDEGSEEPLDPFLLQLPMVDEVAAPIIESRRDVCPEWKFGDRDIALCSADEPQVITYQGTRTITIKNAKIYNPFFGCIVFEQLWCCNSVSLGEPGILVAENTEWSITGFDCLENIGTGIPIPK